MVKRGDGMNQIRSRCGRPSRLLPTLPWVTALLAILVASAPVLAEEDVRAPDPGDADAVSDEQSSTAAHGRQALVDTRVRLDRDSHNVVRAGPGDGYAIVGIYPGNSTFSVIAKKGDWYNIQLSDTETGWVHSSLCEEYDDLSNLEFRPNPRLYSRIGSFVFTVYGGGYAFDRKSNSFALGGRLGYYLLDFLNVEGGVAWTRVHRPAEIVEELFDLTLEAETFHMLFYHMNLNLEVLPGRQMVPFVTGGVGSTIMLGRTEPSINYGVGTKLFVSKRTLMRWEVRNYRFDSGTDDARRTSNNIEFSFGTSILF
jgi:outer membrane beta-barrel protein